MSNQFAAYSQAQIEKSIRLSNAILTQTGTLATTGLETARSLVADSAATAKKFAEVKDIAGLMALQQQLAQPYLTAAKSFSKSALAAGEAVKAEFSHIVEENVAEIKTTFNESLDKAVKVAPEGVKSAFASAKTAATKVEAVLDTATKNAKQISEDFVKASVAAVETASQAATTAAASAKKVAA